MNAEQIEKIRIDKDGDLIFCTVGMYKLFLSRKSGLDAYLLYSHLMFTARLQETNQVKANMKYLKNGLEMGEPRIKRAKALLHDLGLIEYVRHRSQAGTFTETYIKLSRIWSREMLDGRTGSQEGSTTGIDPASPAGSTTGIDIHPVADHTTGHRSQMLKVSNLNALNEKEKGERDTASGGPLKDLFKDSEEFVFAMVIGEYEGDDPPLQKSGQPAPLFSSAFLLRIHDMIKGCYLYPENWIEANRESLVNLQKKFGAQEIYRALELCIEEGGKLKFFCEDFMSWRARESQLMIEEHGKKIEEVLAWKKEKHRTVIEGSKACVKMKSELEEIFNQKRRRELEAV